MKRNSKSRTNNLELYKLLDNFYNNGINTKEDCYKLGIDDPMCDTRYYGLFLIGQGKERRVKIDIKRFKKVLSIPDGAAAVINKRTGPYFIPAKKDYYDYNCNIFVSAFNGIRQEWTENKIMIERVIKEVQDAKYDFNDMCGVLEPDEAMIHSSFMQRSSQAKAEAKRRRLFLSLYAQFFHQMVSKIEAVSLNVLTENGYEGARFDRKVMYAFKGAKQENIKELEGFQSYDLMYAIWHFIKHNSSSTYEAVKKLDSTILRLKQKWDKKEKDELEPYKQGDLAIAFVNFDDKLIQNLIDGAEFFFKEYCRIVFGEDYSEAQWNYDNYFLSQVNSEIDMARNPLGIPWYL